MSRTFYLSVIFFFLSWFFQPSVLPSTQSEDLQPVVRHQEIIVALPAQVETDAETKSILTEAVTVPIIMPEPFLAVAPSLQLTTSDGRVIFNYRSAQGVANWSEWQQVLIDPDSSLNGKINALLFLDKATSHLQFKIELFRDDVETLPQISSLKINFISPGKTPKSKLEQINSAQTRREYYPESSAAKYPKPVVVTRTGWDCPDGQGNPRATPSYTTVTHLIVHHTATSNTSSDWPAVVRSIWNSHVNTNGWSDIGYNYLIDPNGVIYEGRAGGDNVVGAHFSCQNSGTMGVSLLGNFTSVGPSNAALTRLKEILAWKADQRVLDPTGSSYHNGMQQSLMNISGHRDGNGLARSCTATECPGNSFYPMFAGLRADVNGLVNPTNDFLLTAANSKQAAAKGGSIAFAINSSIVSGSAQSINLTVTGLPAEVNHDFNASTITTGTNAQLNLTIHDATPSGSYALTVTGQGTTKRTVELLLVVTGKVASVSAASYVKDAQVATESIVSAFGMNLASESKAAEMRPLPTLLADVAVKVRDSANNELSAPLFYVSPTQINYQIPAGLAGGAATVTVLLKNEVVAMGMVNIANIAPGIFSANANGQGVAAATLQRRKVDGTDLYEPVARYDEAQKLFFPLQLDLSNQTDQYFLTLYGTGIRFRNSALPVTAKIGGTDVEVLYAGDQQQFVGLDQVNLKLTQSLRGRGEISVTLTIEGQTTNPVTVAFK